MRPLGIPTVRDRVVQMATLLILEPIFEADFLDCSYGFRPGRVGPPGVGGDSTRTCKAGYREVYDADLQGYFDSIPHDKLMACRAACGSVDRSVLGLIRMWLEALVVEARRRSAQRRTAVRPGDAARRSDLSACWRTSYLHWFDKRFHRAGRSRHLGQRAAGAVRGRLRRPGTLPGRGSVDWVERTLEDWFGSEDQSGQDAGGEPGRSGRAVWTSWATRSGTTATCKGRGHRYLNMVPVEEVAEARAGERCGDDRTAMRARSRSRR